jgi:putative hemolysin
MSAAAMYPLLIAILILVNGLFVLAEMALVSSRRARMQAAAERGERGARAALELMDNPSRYLSTIQIVITVSGIVLGMFGETAVAEGLRKWMEEVPALRPHAHAVATVATVTLLTLATLLFAELVPKRLGQMFPEGLARGLAGPMSVVSRVAAPLVAVLTLLTEGVLKLIPFRPRAQDEAAEEEVKALMATGAETGVFHQAEQRIVERVFTLGDQRVKAIMVPRTDIDFLNVNDASARVRVAVATSTHSHFPVCDGSLDKLVGYVHVKDLVKHGLISDEIDLRTLARKPVFIPESATAIKTLEQFQSSGVHLAFVLDEYGVVVGLVTLNDIVKGLLGEATVAGQSQDPMVVKRADGSYLLDGMLGVEELRDLMGVDALPKQDVGGFDTLGGFVLTYLGRIPSTGDAFSFDRYTFEVMDMDRTRVDRVLLTIAREPAQESEEE